VTLVLGSESWIGTVDPDDAGTFADRQTFVITGGAGGWAKAPSRLPNSNDAGLRRDEIASALAVAVGESLAIDASVSPALGTHYPRPETPAAEVMHDLFGDVPWWVDALGVTRVGPHPTVDASARVQVLELDLSVGRARLGFLGTEQGAISDVLPGVTLVDPVRAAGESLVIESTRVEVSQDGVSVAVEISRSAANVNDRVAELVAGLSALAAPRRLFTRGPYRYRVYDMQGDRARLQVVNRDLRLPDLIPVDLVPGVAGWAAQLTPGSVVLVDFVEGDPTLPIVTHYTRKGDAGWLPVTLTADAVTSITLGSQTGIALRVGDKVRIVATVNTGTPGNIDGVITLDPTVIAVGVPGVGRSKVSL
jgi:hypothetical protein